MMRSAFWREKWNKSAQENQDIRLISGWGNRTFQELLFSINNIAGKMKLRPEDRLLDIGCGAGLFEIAFAHWVKEICGADYSEEMVKIARVNTKMYDNITVQQCNITSLPYKDDSFDKILVNSVIQYLDSLEEVRNAIKELDRVITSDGIIFLSLIPSASTKKELLEGYHNLGLSSEEIQKKIDINSNILWFEDKKLKKELGSFGFSDIIIAQPCNTLQKKYYFDLILVK